MPLRSQPTWAGVVGVGVGLAGPAVDDEAAGGALGEAGSVSVVRASTSRASSQAAVPAGMAGETRSRLPAGLVTAPQSTGGV